jgi:Flp pilus assembly protein TadB
MRQTAAPFHPVHIVAYGTDCEDEKVGLIGEDFPVYSGTMGEEERESAGMREIEGGSKSTFPFLRIVVGVLFVACMVAVFFLFSLFLLPILLVVLGGVFLWIWLRIRRFFRAPRPKREGDVVDSSHYRVMDDDESSG